MQMRDFKGYAAQPPSIAWPNDARVAVSFVVNFEEGAEFSMSDGDSVNEGVYEARDLQTVPDRCIDSHFEYGTRVGYWRVADLFDKFKACFTLSACGRAVERSPWLALDAVQRGHEVSAHGYRWEKHLLMDEPTERRNIELTVQAIEQATGKRPVGWHTRSSPSANTRRLLVEKGFLYDSDAYNDDTPYYVQVGSHQHVVLPYAFDTNDMHFQHTDRFSTGQDFAQYVCTAFDWLEREGENAPRMLSIGLHLRMIGRPARMAALQQILTHIRTRQTAWVATREQIARHWIGAST